MKAETPEGMAETKKLRQELKAAKRHLAEAILDHRIDKALLEILAEEYHVDIEALKKKAGGMKSPIA